MISGCLGASIAHKLRNQLKNWTAVSPFVAERWRFVFTLPRTLKNSYTHGTFKPPTYRQLPYFITQPKPEGSVCRLYLILTHAVPALCDFDFLSPKPERERTEKKSPFWRDSFHAITHKHKKVHTLVCSHTHRRTRLIDGKFELERKKQNKTVNFQSR